MRLAPCCMAVAVALACSPQRTTISVAEDDPEMRAAIQQARATVPQLVSALQAARPDDEAFSVKVPIRDGEDVEHFWVSDVVFDGTVFRGKLGNEPELVRGHKLGEDVVVKLSEISDWMYLHNGVLVGGYSIRLLRSRMSPEERARNDQDARFRFE